MVADKVWRNGFLESCSWIVDEYSPATYTAIMLLDLVGTIPRLAPWGLAFFTAGFATPWAMAGELGIDFGLMIIAFIATLVLEVLAKRSIPKSIQHGIVSAAFMMSPPPAFTMVLIASYIYRKNAPKPLMVEVPVKRKLLLR